MIMESLRETGGFEGPDLILNVLSSLRICPRALPLIFQTIKQSIVISQDLREQETARKPEQQSASGRSASDPHFPPAEKISTTLPNIFRNI